MSSEDDQYISYPLEADAATLAKEAIQQLMALQPGWVPNEANLEVMLIEVLSTMEAETRYVASLVPAEIFRYAGQSLFNIPAIDGAPATAKSTWTMRDTSGYTIPAGTLVAYQTSGNTSLYFRTQAAVVVAPGSATTSTGEVVLVATDYGTAYNGLPIGAVTLVDALTYVASVASTTITSGGVDRESSVAYLDRLRADLRLLSPRPILPNDFAVLAKNVAGVARAVAIDGYNPADSSSGHERMVTVAAVDAAGEAIATGVKTALAAYLEAEREVNFVVNTMDPTYETVDVNASVKVQAGFDSATVLAACVAAVTNFLEPYNWDWSNKVRKNQLVAVMAEVPGVVYVSNINTPSTDVDLLSVASLVRPGLIQVVAA